MSEKKALLEETFAAIAHQWRQPLNEINALVSRIDNRLYEKKIDDEEIEEYLVEIEKITRSMSQTIDDYRGYFSQSEVKNRVNLDNLLKDIVKEYQSILDRYTISLKINIEKDIYFDGDEQIFKQILLTLLNNAKDALIARSVYNGEICIEAKVQQNIVFLQVSDNAGGIPKSAISKLFNPDFTSKHASEGTGLGLYMVKKLLDEHFLGEIFVKNLEKGVAFEVMIPEKKKES